MRSGIFLVLVFLFATFPLAAAPSPPSKPTVTGGPLLPAKVTHPADKRPGSLGFSFSELTGVGITFRSLDSQGGWQVAAMASSYQNFGDDWYFSGGVAKHSVLYSFVANEWVFSQFYWLGGISWRTERLVEFEWDGEADRSVRSVDWKNVLTAGPALGLEVGLLEYFSFNVEVGYKVGYDFSETTPEDSLTAQPGFSAMFLFRY